MKINIFKLSIINWNIFKTLTYVFSNTYKSLNKTALPEVYKIDTIKLDSKTNTKRIRKVVLLYNN